LILPFTDRSKSVSLQFRPLSKIAFFVFVGNFLILMQLGAKHVESPFIELGQISTFIYFSYFLITLPLLSLIENSLMEIKGDMSKSTSSNLESLPLTSNILSMFTHRSYIILPILFYILINNYDICDAPIAWGVYFQDSATPQMEGIVELHDNILFYLTIILFSVGWMLISLIKKYSIDKSPISHKYLNHGTLIELIWTITPALILILIAFPSFKLLYLMDEVSDPAMSVLAEGHQWYWSYQYPDFLNDDGEYIEFDSYIVPESDLEEGALRMLEVDNRVILPELTHIRFIITAADVIHSFASPALGIKCDAYPGRLNQVSILINREGTFYGQCSEICGILHSSMPIVIESVSIEKFLTWLNEQ
jgi:cytochrome c oxidase subunit II